MNFENLEWNRPVYTHPEGTIRYKRYADKFFWWCEGRSDWIEIKPNREYADHVYCDLVGDEK